MDKKSISFWIDLFVIIIFMMCVLSTCLHFEEYKIAYPNESMFYIAKLIFTTLLISIRANPNLIDVGQSIVFHILFWVSLLSVIPDTIRCILMYL